MAIARTSAGLAEEMFLELDALKAGNSTPQAARAKAALANTICLVSRLEMDYARFVSAQRSGEDRRTLGALQMGLPSDDGAA